MRIGLMYGWGINTLKPGIKGKDKNFLGDEMTGGSVRRELLKHDDVELCEGYCSEHGVGVPLDTDLDIAIDMNPATLDREHAKKKILFYQNGPGEGSDNLFSRIHHFYDGVIFSAAKMWERHGDFVSHSGHSSIFLPLAGDPELFYPVEYAPEFNYDVAYCGNDIKRHRTMPYIGPAMQYNLGLFGRWSEEHRELLGPVSKGQIDFGDLRKLYSSSAIMLNIHFQDCIDWGLWAGRIYDVLLCNGFLISDEPYGIPEEFKKHVVFSSGGDDLASKLDYYLSNPDARDEYTDGARNWIMANHTWERRTDVLHKYLQEIV